MIHSITAGFFTGLSLIVAIGAQNAYVLRQGMLRSHITAVVGVCAVSDLVLILVGVSGIGALVDRAGAFLDVVRWLGVAFLLWYAGAALRRALRPQSLSVTRNPVMDSRLSVIGRAVALTWLNPHVYLDTVLLLGSIAATHDGVPDGRWWFGGGAVTASVVWFASLGFGATFLAPLLSRPRAWRVLELAIATTMVCVAVKLALG